MTGSQAYRKFYNSEKPERWGRKHMPVQFQTTLRWLQEIDKPDLLCVELGCGVGALAEVHPNWVGVEYSLTALTRINRARKVVNADMQVLPFSRSSVDFVFSWAALEHVPRPELVLGEIDRILRPGGIALLAPAWHVRSWAATALPIRSYRELRWADRARKALIPLWDSLAWRGCSALPRRLAREVRALAGDVVPFGYQRLKPNLTEYVYTDCDAFTSMDPHAAVHFYRSRGYEVLSHRTLCERLLSRHEPVVVRKHEAT
jgi:SAM-dependent methyltransferase